jgi:hypothetical protein
MFCHLFSGLLGSSQSPAGTTIAFQVIDTEGCPVCGAVYRLSCECGKFINAISGRDGCVRFCGVCPGTYRLEQIGAAYGYLPNTTPKELLVRRGGCVKVDGLPLCCFQAINEKEPPAPSQVSDPPLIDTSDCNGVLIPHADSVTITGAGTPGCSVEVTFPNGCVCCTTVRRDGSWSADVPVNLTLAVGDAISAVQTCRCKQPSAADTVEVVAAP